jgi:hypothetical protein
MSLAEERIGPGVERAWKVVVGQEVSGNSAVDQKRQQAGALQTLREVEGAVGSRGSVWSAAACRRCGRQAGGSRPFHGMLSPRVEAGALGARAGEAPFRAGKQ